MVRKMHLRKINIAALSASLAGILSACGVGEASTADEFTSAITAPLPVEVVMPVRAEIFATYKTTTTISSDADAPVTARVGGEVVDILVEEGDQVVTGQLLARLDGDRLRLEMEQAKAILQKTEREYERSISLHERGIVSKASFEGMKFDMDSLRASYELKRLNYSYTSIRAPISGVVSARDIKLGQHVSERDTTFRVTDTNRLVAHLKIPQSELAKFSAGHLAEIRVDAMPNQIFAAEIARISPTIDIRNGTFRATAYVNNDSGLLAPGMFGRFNIAYEKHSDALVIPSAAILEEDDQMVIYVVTDGAAVRRMIETGIRENGLVEVLSGLDEYEQIVVTGQGSLRNGSKVLASIPVNTPVTG
jgi:membrane fusion protein (multidrug efflux system)